MQKTLLILIACFISTISLAQTREIDSLKQLLQNEKTDTGRVMLLCEMSFRITGSKPDTAMTLAIEALELSRKIYYEKGEASSLNRIASVYTNNGNYAKGMRTYLEALKINEKIDNLDGQQRNYNNLGSIYLRQGNYTSALNNFLKAKTIAEVISDDNLLAVTLANIARTYMQVKSYDSAVLFAQQAYVKAKQINFSRAAGIALSISGDIYFRSGQNSLALEYCRLGVPYLAAAAAFNSLSDNYLTMAKVFERMGQKDSAIFYAGESLLQAKERAFSQQIHDAATFLSFYYRKYNADSAFYYQDMAKAVNDSLFSQEKQRDIQNLEFDEKLRQQELAAKYAQEEEERTHNLQYAAIALGLVTFLILFFVLSHSVIANQRLIKFLGILSLLIVFEFINLFIHPYLDKWTNHSIPLMLTAMVCIAALLIPLHHKLEHWITHKLVEKNNKIRLAAAKNTIAKLERTETTSESNTNTQQ